MAVLQSVGPDGVARVAHVSDMLYGWLQPRLRLLATARVDAEPEFLVFPFVGPDDRRGQLDPDVLATFQMLPGPLVRDGERRVLRLEGRRLVPVEVRSDGLSEPWAYGRWWIREDPAVAALARGDDGSLISVVRLAPDSLLPATPPFELAAPSWGMDLPYEPEDYVVAVAALESVGSTSGVASVLGSTSTPAGQVSLVGVQPSGWARPSAVVVVETDEGVKVSAARPLDTEAEVAIGAVRTQEGALIVVAAASPRTRLLTIDVDGEALDTLDRAQAIVLPPDADVDVVEARAFLGDDTQPAKTRVVLADVGHQ
ncbi:MAG: hypothetical protein MUF83_20745 [Acidimicrobiales bacterium]|nr:hypothetical protein [Acidimicrobiales bacterium]